MVNYQTNWICAICACKEHQIDKLTVWEDNTIDIRNCTRKLVSKWHGIDREKRTNIWTFVWMISMRLAFKRFSVMTMPDSQTKSLVLRLIIFGLLALNIFLSKSRHTSNDNNIWFSIPNKIYVRFKRRTRKWNKLE